MVGLIFADRRINGILLGKNLEGSPRDKVNTPFLLLKMTKIKAVFCHWGDLRVMTACQCCTDKDPFANTVFLEKKKILILKFKVCPLFFIFYLFTKG